MANAEIPLPMGENPGLPEKPKTPSQQLEAVLDGMGLENRERAITRAKILGVVSGFVSEAVRNLCEFEG